MKSITKNTLVAISAAMAYQQLNGATVRNNKGRAFAIGPSIKYDSGKDWFVTAKYQTEGLVRNRAEGSAFWLKAVVPF